MVWGYDVLGRCIGMRGRREEERDIDKEQMGIE